MNSFAKKVRRDAQTGSSKSCGKLLTLADLKPLAFSESTFEFASVDALLGHLGDVSAPIRMIMATLSPVEQAEFWKKLAEAAAQFAGADGTLRLPNACLVAVGQR